VAGEAEAGQVVAAIEPRYSACEAGDVVRLTDALSRTVVSICPSAGNVAFEMRVRGENVLWFPFDSIDEFKARGHGRAGIPFLGPWANRLDEQAFYANGRRFAFDMQVGNVRGDLPIHGLLMETDRWRVIEVNADDTSAWVTSRVEFFLEPLWMKQFPFAHAIDMTHRLQNGELTVTTKIESSSTDPMPVAIGFHPYFRLTDSDRSDWTVSIGARRRWRLAPNKVPTGETETVESVFQDANAVRVRDHALDDVFDDLIRDARGAAVMSVSGSRQRIDVEMGPNYRSMVVFAPESAVLSSDGTPRRGDFVCLEPMAGISNSMNLAHRGLYHDLQYIPPGGTWQESFRICPKGF
jgi:aldose 1-epimerase